MSATKRLVYVANLVGRSAFSDSAMLAVFVAACGVMLYVVIFA